MARGCADELFLARELPFDRPADLEDRQDAEILGYHLLLAAEAAAHPLGENVELARVEPKNMAELLVHDKRRLRTGADVNPAVVPLPCDRTVRFQMDMLDPRRRVGHLVNGVGCRESILDAADLAMDFGNRYYPSPPSLYRGGSGHLAPSRPAGRKPRAELRSPPGLPDMRLLQRLRFRRRPQPPAGPQSERRCREHRCRRGRPGDPHAWRC